MGAEVTIVCDNCGSVIVAARTAGEARKEGIRDKVMVRKAGKDICGRCDQIESARESLTLDQVKPGEM